LLDKGLIALNPEPYSTGEFKIPYTLTIQINNKKLTSGLKVVDRFSTIIILNGAGTCAPSSTVNTTVV
jgi:hypothetical protein